VDKRLLELSVRNFRSLADVTLPLGDVNVLVGPNGVGKTNVLRVFDFLADVIRLDLDPAIVAQGGFEHLAFWGGARRPRHVEIGFKALWTSYSSVNAPDEYRLNITPVRSNRAAHPQIAEFFQPRPAVIGFRREEEFKFKRTGGRGRRITVSGQQITIADERARGAEKLREIGIKKESSGLSTLPRLSDDEGGAEVSAVAAKLAGFRVYDVHVDTARRPAKPRIEPVVPLENNAGNLSFFLYSMSHFEPEIWESLVEDARTVLPLLDGIEFQPTANAEITALLVERGLRQPTPLADASYGTIRLLGLLAMLYEPDPPALTCIEEIDHGLHPQALELLVHRIREASERTQFIIATHSPALADRLEIDELIVCERRDTGASIIPAVAKDRMRDIVEKSGNEPLGELWFSGALGGDLL
jgi:predicted ATPase